MRRRTRGLVVNLVFFLAALFLLVYLNRSPPTKQTFAWTKIRYKSNADTLPEHRGICPGLKGNSKPALIVARVTTDDVKWLDTLSSKYHLCIYTADAPKDTASVHLQVPANRGHEAMAYLTFIIDNYDHIPAAGAVFVHGSRWAWHNDAPDYDNAALLAKLNVPSALAPSGYHNLRCDWSASTCSPSEAPPQGSLETFGRSILEPWNVRAVSDKALPQALAAIFGEEDAGEYADNGDKLFMGRSDAVRSQCCAQFVVSRDRVWQHSQDEYVALRQWLLDSSSGESANAAPMDDRIAGRILSYVWHILFLPQSDSTSQHLSNGIDLERLNSLACPPANECYCRLYGRCNLEGCDSIGHCQGQYRLPPNFKLPDDWEAKHA